jgi:3-hydroxy-3-methylglutaryl CoA synthase
MAVEAAIDCLNGMDLAIPDGLYFASTTPPYDEKLSASIVAAATDLRDELFTLDIGNSLRSGTGAIKAACDAIKGGSAKNVLVTAADCRLAPPASEFESVLGDGAAAFLIADEDVAVAIEDPSPATSSMFGRGPRTRTCVPGRTALYWSMDTEKSSV